MRIIGEEASLRRVAASQLREYHDAWYRPDKMVIILAGDLFLGKTRDHNSMIKEKTEEWFGGLKGKTESGLEKVKEAQVKAKLEVVTKPDASQAHLVLGVRTFSRRSEDRFAWSLFNLIMGVSFTSRLFKEIREKRGLCYHIRSSSNNYEEVGSWDIYAGVATEKVTEATQAILGELGKAADKGVTDDELTVAKKRLKTLLSFRSEDPEVFTEWYGRQEVYGQELLTVHNYIKRIEYVTKDDINQLSKKYFRTETLNMALVWNKPHDEKLERLLRL